MQEDMDNLMNILDGISSNKIHNYIVPGITSSLVGVDRGRVRMFDNNRHQMQNIIPHSHRFDLSCLVVSGRVVNTLWRPSVDGDLMIEIEQHYLGDPGGYKISVKPSLVPTPYEPTEYVYNSGDWYHMKHDEIHSINFSRGAKVLIFEGEELTKDVKALAPRIMDFDVNEYMKVPGWMFRKEV